MSLISGLEQNEDGAAAAKQPLATVHSVADKDTVDKHPVLLDHLSVELLVGIMQKLPARDRFACAQVNRRWHDLLQSKPIWKDCTALAIHMHRDSKYHGRFTVFDPSLGVPLEKGGCNKKALTGLWPLLPPITTLHLSSVKKYPFRQAHGTMACLSELLADVRLHELYIDAQITDHLLTDQPLETCWPFASLIHQLVVQSVDCLRVIKGVKDGTLKIYSALRACTRLHTVALEIAHDDCLTDAQHQPDADMNTNYLRTSSAIDFMHSKGGDLRWLSVRLDRDHRRRTLVKVLSVCASSAPTQVHLELDTNGDNINKMFKQLMDADSTVPNVVSLKLKYPNFKYYEEYQEEGQVLSSLRPPWLTWILQKWLPGLRRLVVLHRLSAQSQFALVQQVLRQIMLQDRGHTVQFMLPCHAPAANGANMDYVLKERLQATYFEEGYSCVEQPLPIDMQLKRGQHDIYKWQLVITRDLSISGTQLVVFGAH